MRILAKRRRQERKTSYLKRKRLLESGLPRIVVRKTNKYIVVQYVESKTSQDKVKYSATSKELLKNGWPKEKQGSLKNLAASYLTGLLFSKKLGDEKNNEMILDTGLERVTSGSRIYAVLSGIVAGGARIKHSEEVLIDEDKAKEKSEDIFNKVKEAIK